VASFIGMAPIDDPRVVVAVVLDLPREDASGGKGAAPVFAEVALAALHQLGVPPDGE
jgi:cell division protein FtsI (penicillin-binding protein 3)